MPSIKEIYPDVETWCRLCLKESKDAYAIFDEDDSVLSIPMRLMACLSVEAKSSDGLPKKICGDCRYQLEKSFLFRQRSQNADKKLRKHIRLVSMGKKSRVFSKSEDNDSEEDELEFEESIDFISKLEKQREEEPRKWREKFKEEQEKELLNRIESIREELRTEVRKELEDEVRDSVRQQLHGEVQEECRKEQLGKLLGELEIFLGEKKAVIWGTGDDPSRKLNERSQSVVASIEVEAVCPQPTAQSSVEKRYVRKRSRITSPIIQQKKRRSNAETIEDDYSLDSSVKNPLSAEDVENDMSPADTAESVASLQMVSDGDLVTTENGEIYIINAGSKANQTAPSSSESYQDKNITSYNIRDNGEISFHDSKSDDMTDVMVFDLDGNVNEDQPLFELKDNVIILSNDKVTSGKSQRKDFVVKESPRNPQPKAGRHTDTLKSFPCTLCPVAFATEKQLARHTNTHMKTMKNGSGGSFTCPVCQMQLSCASSLKRHMVTHTGLKPYKCEECGLSFSQREVLKRHSDTHTGLKRHQCPHCSVYFAQKNNLTQHINRMHTLQPVQTHKCHICHRGFSHISGLSRHLVTHAGVTFACKECGKKFSDRSSVQRHVQHVHKIKDYDGDSAVEEDNGNNIKME